MRQSTFPQILRENFVRWKEQRTALRKKDLGIWKSYAWNGYWSRVKDLSLGLGCLGLVPGERVVIIGDNSPEWVIAELAIQSVGGVPSGAFTDATPEELLYILEKIEARFVVARDQEQVDKFIEISGRCPWVRSVLYWDPKGMRNYDHERFLGFDRVEQLGRELDEKDPQLFDRLLDKGEADDDALILFTSGTGGRPKAAVHTYRSLGAVAEGWMKINHYRPDDEYISFAPLAWIPEQLFAVVFPLYTGYVVNFPEKAESVREDMREISPTIIALSPRLWEDMSSTVLSRMADSGWMRRGPYSLFLSLGHRVANRTFENKQIPLWMKTLNCVGELFLYRPLRDNLGLRNNQHAYSGGADLGADTFRFYKAIGVNIKQLYGMTESGGINVSHRDSEVKFSTVGKPLEGNQVSVAEDGEILIRGPSLFKEYYRDLEGTKAAFTEDGWLLTGDAGFFDEDGQLVCIGRLKDLMTLSDGRKFSPVLIEAKLKFSPYIKDAVVFGGEGRPYLTAILAIDFEIVSAWAEKRGIPFTTYTDLSQRQEVYDLAADHVAWVNRDLPESAQIKRFTNLYKELDPDESELTRSRKLRRSFFVKKYPRLLESLYGELHELQLEGEIRYRDGKTAVIRTWIRIRGL